MLFFCPILVLYVQIFVQPLKPLKVHQKIVNLEKSVLFAKVSGWESSQKQFSNKYLQNFQMFENHPMKKLFVLIIFNRLDDNPMPGNTVFSNISVYSLNYGVIT